MFHEDALYKFTFYLLTFTYLLMLTRKLAALASHGQVTRPVEVELVAFSSSLYTTICNPKPNPNLKSNPDPNPNPNPSPNRNPTVITDPQIGPIDPQIVTVQIRPAPHFVAFL